MFARRRMDRRIARRVSRRTVHRMMLAGEDIARIERDTGQKAETLTEEQLAAAMKKLGIKKLEVGE